MEKRKLYDLVEQVLGQYPVMALTGPRQSGKTTMLKTMLKDYRYVTLENPDNREYAEKDPKAFLNQYDHHVIFDEVQNVPKLFSYIQGIVDENQVMGQFVLSGSQNFHVMENITQSLAGRVAMFKLFPFDFEEMNSAGWFTHQLPETITKGFYPAIFERGIDQDRYYANYIETYVNRDVSQLINIQDLRSFKTFVKLCAARAGQLLNLSDLARDVGVSHTTARNWISLLETSYILYLLPPYYNNFGKRLIKSPKLYFYDVGLLCHLLSIRKGDISPAHPSWGHIFENMVISELIKQNEHRGLGREYFFWRDSNGHEVDLLYKEGTELSIYEIKASTTVQNKMFEGLEYFAGIANEKVGAKNLVYGGNEAQQRTNCLVVPWMEVG